MPIIDDIKIVLRISNTAFDTEITDLIASAKADLGLSGVLDDAILETDPLIKRAIITYCKANFGWDNPDSEKLQKSYEMLKGHLSLSGDYSFYKVDFVVDDGSTGTRAKITLNEEQKDTNADGEATFYMRAKNKVEYTDVAEGYKSESETIDIEENKTISVSLVVV